MNHENLDDWLLERCFLLASHVFRREAMAMVVVGAAALIAKLVVRDFKMSTWIGK